MTDNVKKRKSWQRVLLWLGLGLLLILAVGPFLIPVPPLTGTVPPQMLADEDSRFITANGISVHYQSWGAGPPDMLLLHGFGASTFTWREVGEPLTAVSTPWAFDRPAFGLTERPLPPDWPLDQNPYTAAAQTDLTIALLDAWDVDQAVLVGNSAGGTIALYTALRHPERVSGLVLVAPAVYTGGGAPSWIRPLFALPQFDRLGPLLARTIQEQGDNLARLSWHNPDAIPADAWAGYRRPLQADNWDLALWELTKVSQELNLADQLDQLPPDLPILLITGDDDRVVPTADTIRLADALPQATLVVIPNCGHVPQEECPEAFVEAVAAFLNN